MNKNQLLMSAAVAGILSAGVLAVTPALAGDKAEKGHCIGANACKGKSACKMGSNNACKGQNGCKGQGGTESTKAACEKIAKKNKDVKFEAEGAAGGEAAPAAKTEEHKS